MKWIALLFVMFCVGCTPSIHMPGLTKQTPDVLTNDTQVVVGAGVIATLDRGSRIQTESEVEATLSQDTKGMVDGKETQLPKNAKVVLPSNVSLLIKDTVTVKLDEAADITLKKGTVITMHKVNWYAVLFYLVLIGGAAYWLFCVRNQDKDDNQDGFVDRPKKKK